MNLSDEIEAHGQLKGIAQFFEDRKMTPELLVDLADAPAACPWYAVRELPSETAIEQVFAPIEGKMPGTVRLLKEYCHALFAAFADGKWYLLYLVYMWGSDYYLWVGGAPAEGPVLSPDIQQAGWTLPPALRSFYRVHHGFGESDTVYAPKFDDRLWTESCVKPAHRLALLEQSPRGEGGDTYQPGEALFFLHDGGGDHYGFLKQTGAVAYYTRDENLMEHASSGDFFQTMDEYFSDLFY